MREDEVLNAVVATLEEVAEMAQSHHEGLKQLTKICDQQHRQIAMLLEASKLTSRRIEFLERGTTGSEDWLLMMRSYDEHAKRGTTGA